MGSARLRVTTAWTLAYLVAAFVWVVVGDPLPGGRWLAVHLFTLGVITNAVVGFSGHFAMALTHHGEPSPRWWPPALNAGVVLVLAGIPTRTPWAVAAGSSLMTVVIVLSYRRLREIRRAAVAARFAWIVRAYERAHGAFVHGALLGALIGTGVLTGTWAGSARLAHLHVNLLGWAGLTLLPTLVFLGPAMARTRILPGADRRSAAALRHAATALTVGVVSLLLTGAGSTPGFVAGLVAGVALAAYAAGATVACLRVVHAAFRARRSFGRAVVVSLGMWLPVVVWADAAAVMTGEYRLLNAMGLALLLGVLGQALLGTISHFAPLFRATDQLARASVGSRLERAPLTRAAAFNVGTALVVVSAATDAGWSDAASRLGWALVLLVIVGQGVLAALPMRAPVLALSLAPGPRSIRLREEAEGGEPG